MLATLISIILVIVFTLGFEPAVLAFFPVVALAGGIVTILVTPLIVGLTLIPLQASSVETSSRAMSLARKDPFQIVLIFVWISFAIYSLAAASFASTLLFVLWVVWLGVSLDAMVLYMWRATGFSDPYHLVDLHVKNGIKNFPADSQKELCASIDALAEVSLKAMYQKSLPLSSEVVDSLEGLGRDYLKYVDGTGGADASGRVNYTLGFLFHRLQMLFDLAAEDRLEPMGNRIILCAAKLTAATAKFDPSQASLPIHFLEGFIETATEYELKEVTVNSSIVLQEIIKSMIEDPELRGKNLSGVLFSLIGQMEKLATETFKEDKSTPIPLLTEPFRDLQTHLEEKISDFPESQAVIAHLKRIVTDFQALQGVLQSIPDIPGYSKEKPKEESEEESEEEAQEESEE